jgi:hypothetical protein
MVQHMTFSATLVETIAQDRYQYAEVSTGHVPATTFVISGAAFGAGGSACIGYSFRQIAGSARSNVQYMLDPSTNEWIEIDPEQRWFWTADWQAGETEASEQLATGAYETFDDLDDFLASL